MAFLALSWPMVMLFMPILLVSATMPGGSAPSVSNPAGSLISIESSSAHGYGKYMLYVRVAEEKTGEEPYSNTPGCMIILLPAFWA